jgi:cytochrome b561
MASGGDAMRRNTTERWGSVSITLHWTIAALILCVQVPVGLSMEAVGRGPLQDLLYNIHKNNGLLVFTLAVIRLSWRWSNPVPRLPADLPAWQATAARTTHRLLYLLLFLMPISGFLYTTLSGYPVPVLGLYDLAQVMPRSKPWGDAMKIVHLTGQWLLYLVVALHVAGALQHHLQRQDGVLRRMLSSTASVGRI